jgi:hypothetical protein
MGRLKKERKFLHILPLNGGAGTYLTTFATPSLEIWGDYVTVLNAFHDHTQKVQHRILR